MTTISTGGCGPTRPTGELLREQALFGALPDAAVDFLTTRLELKLVPAGAVVFEEGEPGRALFVLVEGELEVFKGASGSRQTCVGMLGPGDWIGEMSIVDIQPRPATVRATTKTRMLVVTAADLDALYRFDLRAYTILVLNLARELSRRLRVADALIAEVAATVTARR